jgi:hypothetical protein
MLKDELAMEVLTAWFIFRLAKETKFSFGRTSGWPEDQLEMSPHWFGRWSVLGDVMLARCRWL